MSERLRPRLLRRALRGRPGPVGLRDERVRAGEVRRDDRGAGRPALRQRAGDRLLDRRAHRSGSPRTCDDLLAIDVAEAALDRGTRARSRTSPSSGARSPRSSRTAPFDLTSSRRSCTTSTRRPSTRRCNAIERTLTGTLLAVHWRPDAQRYPFRGDEVHELLTERFGAPALLAPRPTSTSSTASTHAARDRRRRPGRARHRARLPGGRTATATSPSSRPSWRSPTSARRCPRSSCAGRCDDAELPIEPASWYENHGVDVRLGARGRDARPGGAHDRARHRARRSRYDACVLATGAEPALLPVPGATEEWVLLLRSLATARVLRDRAAAAKTAVVVGSGFIGCEAAASLAHARAAGDAGQRRGRSRSRPGSARRPAAASRAGSRSSASSCCSAPASRRSASTPCTSRAASR